MKILCTYCAGPKRTDRRLLPAVRRYLGDRIAGLHAEAGRRGPEWGFRILSGRFGLLAPDTPLPWYDHLLAADEVSTMAATVAAVLVRDDVSRVEYHTADADCVPQVAPYLDVMRRACTAAAVPLEVVVLAGDPD